MYNGKMRWHFVTFPVSFREYRLTSKFFEDETSSCVCINEFLRYKIIQLSSKGWMKKDSSLCS